MQRAVLFCQTFSPAHSSDEDEEDDVDEALEALLSDDFVSLFLLSLFLLLLELELELPPESELLEERLSVLYHPDPLKTMPDGWMTRRTVFLLHSGQRVMGWSVNF